MMRTKNEKFYWVHGTTTKNLRNIMQHGLLPDAPDSPWKDTTMPSVGGVYINFVDVKNFGALSGGFAKAVELYTRNATSVKGGEALIIGGVGDSELLNNVLVDEDIIAEPYFMAKQIFYDKGITRSVRITKEDKEDYVGEQAKDLTKNDVSTIKEVVGIALVLSNPKYRRLVFADFCKKNNIKKKNLSAADKQLIEDFINAAVNRSLFLFNKYEYFPGWEKTGRRKLVRFMTKLGEKYAPEFDFDNLFKKEKDIQDLYYYIKNRLIERFSREFNEMAFKNFWPIRVMQPVGFEGDFRITLIASIPEQDIDCLANLLGDVKIKHASKTRKMKKIKGKFKQVGIGRGTPKMKPAYKVAYDACLPVYVFYNSDDTLFKSFMEWMETFYEGVHNVVEL